MEVRHAKVPGAGDLSTFLSYLVGGSETTPDSATAEPPAPDFIRLLVPGVLLDDDGAVGSTSTAGQGGGNGQTGSGSIVTNS